MVGMTRRALMCTVCYRFTGHERDGFGQALCDLCHEDMIIADALIQAQRDRYARRKPSR